MTTTMYFVRHGSHDRLGKILCGRMAGVDLSARGEAEAQAAAERLKGRDIAAVYTSPMARTRQTAEPIARALGVEGRIDEQLTEIEFGDWTGRSFATLAGDPVWSRWNSDRDQARAPGGETMAQAQARVLRFIEQARGDHAGEAIVAVSHADVIKAAVLHVLGLPLQAYGRIEIDPGSFSVIVAGDWGAKVHSINEVAA